MRRELIADKGTPSKMLTCVKMAGGVVVSAKPTPLDVTLLAKRRRFGMSGKGNGGPVPQRRGEYDPESKRWDVTKAKLWAEAKEYGWMYDPPTATPAEAPTVDSFDLDDNDPNDLDRHNLFGETYLEEDARHGGWD